MKKIFAFILAMIMVLSIVPASAFAAFNNCPDTHTKANCAYTKVAEISATCTSYGYTAYKCNKCGTEFLDDFSSELKHPWISTADSKHVNKAATCTEDGYEWVKCSACTTAYIADTKPCQGVYCGDATCTLRYVEIKASHNPEKTGIGLGCETEYKCSDCGTILYYDAKNEVYVTSAAHPWNYIEAEIIDAPYWENGEFHIGHAYVVCSAEGCPADKTVDITEMECKHYVYELVQPYVANTCTTDGTKGVYKCRDCYVYFVDNTGDGVVDGKLLKDNKETKDLTVAVLKALGHKAPVVNGEKVYVSNTNCKGTYECVNCKTLQTETAHLKPIQVGGNPDVKPNCTTDGYDYKYCEACFTSYAETIAKTGHKKATVTIIASCVNGKGTYTFCVNENCPLVPQEYIDAYGNTKKDGTGTNNFEAVKKAFKDNGVSDAAIAEFAQARPQTAYGSAGYVYKLRVLKTEGTGGASASSHTLWYLDLTDSGAEASKTKPTAACNTFKIIQTICPFGCGKSDTDLLDAAGHTEYISRQFANCSEATKHVWNGTETILAPYHMRTVYSCKVCKQEVRYVDTQIQFTTEYADESDIFFYHGITTRYADDEYKLTQERFTRANVNRVSITPNGYVKPATCLATGLEQWGCQQCKVSFFKTLDKVIHTQEAGVAPVYTGAVEAKCDEAGVWGSLVCTYCKNTVIFNPYLGKNGEQQIVTSLVVAPHGNSLKPVTPSSDAKACAGVPYYECDCGETFTDWTAKTKFDTTANHHNWKYLQNYEVANCNTTGEYEIRYCKNNACARYEVNAYYEQEGQVKVKLVASGTRIKEGAIADTDNITIKNRKSDGTLENKTFKILKDGSISGSYTTDVPFLNHCEPLTTTEQFTTVNRPYGENHSTPYYNAKQCKYCDFEYFTDYVAASGAHMNKYGEILTTKCDNASIQDRVCVFCPAADNVIDSEHNYAAAVKVDPTCVVGGYTYKTCKDCGYRNVYDVTAKSDSYHTSAKFITDGNKVVIGSLSNFASNGSEYSASCKLCNQLVDKITKPEPQKEAGFEIFLETTEEIYIPGATVEVAILLDSLKGVDVWSVQFPVTYDTSKLEFIDYTFNTATSDFQTFAATDVKTYTNVVYEDRNYNDVFDDEDVLKVADTLKTESIGVINIVANAGENVTIKGEQTLAVLKFKVKALSATTDVIKVEKLIEEDDGYAYYQGYKTKTDKYGTSYNEPILHVVETGAFALDANRKEVNVLANAENTEEIVIKNFLDLDNNGKLNMLDAYDLYSIIFNGGYDPIADADGDKRITGLDLAVLYNILTGATSVESYVNPQADITPMEPRNN